MNQTEWLIFGVEHGYCSQPVCDTHDSVPMTDEEAAEFDDGGDPCITVVRLLDV